MKRVEIHRVTFIKLYVTQLILEHAHIKDKIR